MSDTSELVHEITGIRPKIIRFPGGSHNRLKKGFLHKLHDHGFKVFDWTHSCEDGMHSDYSSEKLYKNSLHKIISRKKSPGIILLLHCNENNKNTIKALPKIINHYWDEGFTFERITEDTPEYYSE